ncbi:hypothetical protein H4R33_002098 [Dimargaris cristalligena]|uniref:DDB1- and CUL4-associated factor 15 WD40 repeat-containing domain-containing protein n=1 Tax=Dimargaris cristalligena TaxID=215637 RepID=A0A4Q0A329_9FUNG|nr:hypothetical protein H4R33_002098 [Dimargaris cristalligena]RKP39792.1 hypothetical protein BJ085DRAFT_36734 [Dimargaris cristalligena]|eukprot:RKP39792.1 hypothetical protein BJ085DRAFT_36734 [Dimargaris cristalligena]
MKPADKEKDSDADSFFDEPVISDRQRRRDIIQCFINLSGFMVAVGLFVAVIIAVVHYKLTTAVASFSLLGTAVVCAVALASHFHHHLPSQLEALALPAYQVIHATGRFPKTECAFPLSMVPPKPSQESVRDYIQRRELVARASSAAVRRSTISVQSIDCPELRNQIILGFTKDGHHLLSVRVAEPDSTTDELEPMHIYSIVFWKFNLQKRLIRNCEVVLSTTTASQFQIGLLQTQADNILGVWTEAKFESGDAEAEFYIIDCNEGNGFGCVPLLICLPL